MSPRRCTIRTAVLLRGQTITLRRIDLLAMDEGLRLRWTRNAATLGYPQREGQLTQNAKRGGSRAKRDGDRNRSTAYSGDRPWIPAMLSGILPQTGRSRRNPVTDSAAQFLPDNGRSV